MSSAHTAYKLPCIASLNRMKQTDNSGHSYAACHSTWPADILCAFLRWMNMCSRTKVHTHLVCIMGKLYNKAIIEVAMLTLAFSNLWLLCIYMIDLINIWIIYPTETDLLNSRKILWHFWRNTTIMTVIFMTGNCHNCMIPSVGTFSYDLYRRFVL